jgi:MOSC domain-containing protein YiiM
MITVVAVRVGMPSPIGPPDYGIVSSIVKRRPAADTLELGAINLAGDDQSDRTVHGGVDKAVYAYPSEHLAGWAADLGQPDLAADPAELDVAAFGENVSTAGTTESAVCIGDIWRWGTATLQVCQPRWPCQKLTLHRAHPRVGPLMRSSGRTGWYLRVVQPGIVQTSGTIEVEPHPAGLTVLDAHHAMEDRALQNRELIERLVALGDLLADEWRAPLVERIES